ncbi:MAG: N(G),N(G)-dimethylarginine dimethylaminohydrolase [Anaerolineae bacterium]|nr:N(G),N(G)-dimethylarginine dimethylaminohydrolase [Anaerolineae bacterium]
MLSQAIVRPPATTFAQGITTAKLGRPDVDLALLQHEEYCQALEQCGLDLIRLRANPNFPDSTFVEDTAIVTETCALLTRPGAPSRMGEVNGIASILGQFYPELTIMKAGTLDGGDVCQAEEHFFIGLSARTNERGAQQLVGWLQENGFTASCVDIRGLPELLHLKTGLSYLGDNRLVLHEALAGHEAFKGFEQIVPQPEEAYAANCIRVNDHVLLPTGYPQLETTLQKRGYTVITLDMSEFRKMDGGLSCLSLRF